MESKSLEDSVKILHDSNDENAKSSKSEEDPEDTLKQLEDQRNTDSEQENDDKFNASEDNSKDVFSELLSKEEENETEKATQEAMEEKRRRKVHEISDSDDHEKEDDGSINSEPNENSVITLDDDEDRRNPMYIPKKGFFYEHDDRIDSEEEIQDKPKEETNVKKKLWKCEMIDRWGHDKFLELDQGPKSKEELVKAYGYDIRNEDTAPKARRRRRYGRGPNKYHRNWENEVSNASAQRSWGGRGRGWLKKESSSRDKSHIYESDVKLETEMKQNSAPQIEEQSDHMFSSGNSSKGRGNGSFASRSKRGAPSSRGSFNDEFAKNFAKGFEIQQSSRGRLHLTSRRVEIIEGKMMKVTIKDNDRRPMMLSKDQQDNQCHDKIEVKMDRQIVPLQGRSTKRYSSARQNKGHQEQESQRSPSPKHKISEKTIEKEIYNHSLAISKSDQFSKLSSHDENNFSKEHYPNEGPPNAAPFVKQPTKPASQAQQVEPSSTGIPTVTGFQSTGPQPSYITNGMLNYGPPPVQYTPVTVPISLPLVGIPDPNMVGPVTGPPLLPPHLTGTVVSSPEQGLMAISGPQGPPTGPAQSGYAVERGGVTYFNPTAQAPVVERKMNKRPKAAIPIVDPRVRSTENELEVARNELTSPLEIDDDIIEINRGNGANDNISS